MASTFMQNVRDKKCQREQNCGNCRIKLRKSVDTNPRGQKKI